MRKRINQKIKDIESDIEAIRNDEALYLYNMPKKETIEKSKDAQIQFQLDRIVMLKSLKKKTKTLMKKELVELQSVKNPTTDDLVNIDLYRIALGVL